MPLNISVLNEGKLYHVCSEETEVKNLQTILTRGELGVILIKVEARPRGTISYPLSL